MNWSVKQEEWNLISFPLYYISGCLTQKANTISGFGSINLISLYTTKYACHASKMCIGLDLNIERERWRKAIKALLLYFVCFCVVMYLMIIFWVNAWKFENVFKSIIMFIFYRFHHQHHHLLPHNKLRFLEMVSVTIFYGLVHDFHDR